MKHGVVLTDVQVSSNEPDDAADGGDGATTGETHGADGFPAPVDATAAFHYDAELSRGQLRAGRQRR